MSEDSAVVGRGETGPRSRRRSRRRVLTLGLGGAAAVIAGAATGIELVSRGELPGKTVLDKIDGACSVPRPPLEYSPLGPSFSGAFYSHARRRRVGYTIAYPPDRRPGGELPLVVMLHGFGGNHTDALAGMSPAQAVALRSTARRSLRWRSLPSTAAADTGTPIPATIP